MEIKVSGSPEFMIIYNTLEKKDAKKIDKVMDDMKNDDNKGEKIERRLFPKEYLRKYHINNLFRYEIGNSRLLYTIMVSNNEKIYWLLGFLTHSEYDELFGYKTS